MTGIAVRLCPDGDPLRGVRVNSTLVGAGCCT
jgi:hypothetical protein